VAIPLQEIHIPVRPDPAPVEVIRLEIKSQGKTGSIGRAQNQGRHTWQSCLDQEAALTFVGGA